MEGYFTLMFCYQILVRIANLRSAILSQILNSNSLTTEHEI